MSERDYLMDLYDIYKDLLTDKQREYFQNYYFEDLTLQEASDELNVSKQIISKNWFISYTYYIFFSYSTLFF